MHDYRVTIGEDGRILIPVYFRRQLHLKPGEELVISIDKNELHLMSIKHTLKELQHLVKQRTKGRSLVKKLKAMRQDDNKHEE